MTTREALMRLGASTAEAIAKVLESLCPDQVERGDVSVLNPDTGPFATLEVPAVAVSVAYVDGVTGGNVFVMTATGARRIAASMMGMPAPEDSGTELSVLELSAVAEAANQMMAAAAAATGVVLGQEVEIAPPETRLFSSSSEAADAYELAPHGTRATFRVCGEACRLVQLVPNAFVVRMTRALDEMGVEHVSGDGAHGSGGDGEAIDERVALDEALRDIRVRVWAELGRTRLPLGDAPEMPTGHVLELDRKADEPVDLYVNGLRFASGTLVLTDDGEWALRLAEVAGHTESEKTPEKEGMVS
ncbi:FliM/FliN family flagellar motor switch protein [Conexibacter sp. JD483]|uniref:FliM/FliN family flagellar motor switch protein n=1 Tax=unclassified Conexibacter TaxID=2627773 RepID=UPI00271BD9FF|nr:MULTISPECIES: FliM/FliN family flagellar motor switch protein [unclassified Conexibacter]MDO8188213.1 FliM/FliN family flagellar motor switch protein [Conexibacter sp. CPCC 205706]MDO8201823.1 FliM/FliN family flagellar motor switch protein [Conexibacter sp. CPCC 205762]MDR9370821.1 FliM/FliN family flagellar motor switch protein [Conexibacter sp. JD483]